jgi:hypothetical protein
VRRRKCGRRLDRKFQNFADLQFFAIPVIIKGFAVDEIADDKLDYVSGFVELIDRHDVRMIQSGNCFGFLMESPQAFFV